MRVPPGIISFCCGTVAAVALECCLFPAHVNAFTANSDRDRVLDATDLVALISEHVQLRPKGREMVGLCPFHDDRTPSMHVVTHKSAGFYKCFACGAAGNAIDFMMNYHKMEFTQALRALAERAGIELRNLRPHETGPTNARTELLRANAIALDFYRRMLADAERGAAARAALDERGISAAMRERFQLGAAPRGWDHFLQALQRLRQHRQHGGNAEGVPDLEVFRAAGLVRTGSRGMIDGFHNRLIFPICDEMGKPIAFGARRLDPEDEPKYLNSPESAVFHKGKGLYALHLARKEIIARRTAVICEGYTDVIACHAAGVENAVATLGTALTRDHARVLQRMCDRVVLLFDGDEAGQRAADRAVEVFFAEPIDVHICTLPDGLDPDELLRQPEGRERFDAALEASESALSYLVRRFRVSLQSTDSLSGRQQRVQALLQRLVELGYRSMPGLRKQSILPSLSLSTGILQRELERALEEIRTPAGRMAGAARGEAAPHAHEPMEPAPASARVPGRVPATETITLEDRGYTPAQARARREAERSVLALLCAFPERVAHDRLVLDDGCTLPVAEAITPDAFEDPQMHAIAQVIHPWLEDGHEFSASTLLSEVTTPTLKGVVTDLLETGVRRAPEGKGASERLAVAFADLERMRRLRAPSGGAAAGTPSSGSEEASSSQIPPGSALQAAIEQARNRGHNPGAISRLIRRGTNQPA